jgi:hypothetical protein
MPARDQIAALLSDAKWVILACLVFSAFLLIPDQTLELYRIIYSISPRDDPQAFLRLHFPVLCIGLAVWFAAAGRRGGTGADPGDPAAGRLHLGPRRISGLCPYRPRGGGMYAAYQTAIFLGADAGHLSGVPPSPFRVGTAAR